MKHSEISASHKLEREEALSLKLESRRFVDQELESMHNGRLIVRHVIISLVFLVLFFVLNRPELIFISQFGLSAWYPATGLVLALMLGISPATLCSFVFPTCSPVCSSISGIPCRSWTPPGLSELGSPMLLQLTFCAGRFALILDCGDVRMYCVISSFRCRRLPPLL